LSAVGAATWLAWLLWRYVPPHAALFAGLGLPLPRATTLVFAASNWFVRLLPILILLMLVVVRLVFVPLFRSGFGMGERGAILVLVGMLSVVGLAELGACAFVVQALQAGCSRATADPRYQQELTALVRSGESPCSVRQAP